MYKIEVTDTFGGEPNYVWVRRETLDAPATLSRQALVRRVKALIGWTGARCDVTGSNNSDTVEIRPRGACVVAFITYQEE